MVRLLIEVELDDEGIDRIDVIELVDDDEVDVLLLVEKIYLDELEYFDNDVLDEHLIVV